VSAEGEGWRANSHPFPSLGRRGERRIEVSSATRRVPPRSIKVLTYPERNGREASLEA